MKFSTVYNEYMPIKKKYIFVVSKKEKKSFQLPADLANVTVFSVHPSRTESQANVLPIIKD